MKIKELNDKIDYTDKAKCKPLDWDVVWTSNNWRDLIIKDSEVAGFSKGDEVTEFMDYNIPMRVYRIEGYRHSLSSNSYTDELYICKRDEVPSEDTLEPFIDTWWNLWGIETKPKLYRIHDDVYSGINITITRNGVPFDTISARDMGYGLIEAQHMINKLNDPTFPFPFHEIGYKDNIVGTKCLWKGKKAVVKSYIDGQNCVILDIANSEEDFIKDHIFSSSFDWWPKDKK